MTLQDWTLYCEGFPAVRCTAPCTLFSTLLEHGLIPDPFYGLNEAAVTQLSDRDCAFETRFLADETLLGWEHIDLCPDGLDTLCRIVLNGQEVARTRNMHRRYCFPVKQLLQPGENVLRLEFSSPTRFYAEEDRRHYTYCNDGDTLPGTAGLRKAFCHSGWDWGPTLPDMGIFRPIRLLGWNEDRITDLGIRQEHSENAVTVHIRVDTRTGTPAEGYVTLDGQTVPLHCGCAAVTIETPRLWWVRGYGEQPLYAVEAVLTRDGEILDRAQRRIGLRTLTVSTRRDPDGVGSEFCFVNNGVKIFAMGGNYIPQDSLTPRITRQKLEEMLGWCLDGNFNCLRVWGGAFWPGDDFYDLCDEYGILIWQDYMIACANIYLTSEMEQELREEARDNLQRIHHHACLGLLCGNNEMEDGVLNWGFRDNQLVRDDYIRLYEHILPELTRQYAPDTFYWPSSPSSGGGFQEPGRFDRGDTHYWEVWHGGVPFTAYRQKHFRFCSEYGFESFPNMKTIRAFCPEEERNCFSRIMEGHQKCRGGNGKILRYLADNYLYPGKFEDLVYASQMLQADAIRYGVEHFRRERGWCMGSIYWQFNDCWPVASWSSVDYYGRYKALHYAARRFYAPVAMGLFAENGTMTVNIANETRAAFRGSLKLSLQRSDLTVLWEAEAPVSVGALRSRDVWTEELTADAPYDTFFCARLLDENGTEIAKRIHLFVPDKHFAWRRPQLRTSLTPAPEGFRLEVAADVLAKGVFLDLEDADARFSDNFFDLTDSTPTTVTIRTDLSADRLLEQLHIKTVYDIR